MGIPWRTYQSSISSPDIFMPHIYAENNPNVGNVSPYILASYDGQCQEQSEALYKNGTQQPYRFVQTVRPTWYAQDFDWQTEEQFQVRNFASSFGQSYEEGTKGLPGYNESRLLYGR